MKRYNDSLRKNVNFVKAILELYETFSNNGSNRIFFSFFPYLQPPKVTYRNKLWLFYSIKDLIQTTHLDEAIEFDEDIKKILSNYYDDKLIKSLRKAQLYIIIFISIPLIAVVPILDFLRSSFRNYLFVSQSTIFQYFFWSFLFLICNSFAFLIIGSLGIRIIRFTLNRMYADVFCVVSILHILIDLNQRDIFVVSENKMQLLTRINWLAKITLILAEKNKTLSSSDQTWVNNHFESMAVYILERGRWLIAPTECTIVDLKNDFNKLAKIFITGNYGDFEWIKKPEEAQTKIDWKQRVLLEIPRISSIGIPFILLIPGVNKYFFTANQQNILSLVLVAWLLACIDITLKLGIIKSVIELMKGIKDLK